MGIVRVLDHCYDECGAVSIFCSIHIDHAGPSGKSFLESTCSLFPAARVVCGMHVAGYWFDGKFCMGFRREGNFSLKAVNITFT